MPRCCSFIKMSKTMSWKYVFTCVNIFCLVITETRIVFETLFYSFLKKYSTTASPISGTLSTIIIFKLCKFNVNLWTLCFFVLQKVHRPFKYFMSTNLDAKWLTWIGCELHVVTAGPNCQLSSQRVFISFINNAFVWHRYM